MRANRPTIWHTLPAALLLLLVAACSRHEERLRQLEQLEARNSADSMMTDDALAETLASYFDDGGTPNERMRAHYILARTYADLGETPAALQSYLDAADAADTTAADCDWAKLSRVYGQMSIIFYNQNLLDKYLECLEHSADYAWRAGDTLQALAQNAYIVVGYGRQKRFEAATSLYPETYKMLKDTYGKKLASAYSISVVNSFLETNRLQDAKMYLDDIACCSGYLDSMMNVVNGLEIYYYYFGEYYRRMNVVDSAAFFFRKELNEGTDFNNQNAASRGLALLYTQTGCPDSAAKYALYSYAMNDSMYAQMATKTIANALASYNYTRNKELAEKEHNRANKERSKVRMLICTILLVVAVVAFVIKRMKRKEKRAKEKNRKMQKELVDAVNNVTKLRSYVEFLELFIVQKEDEKARQWRETVEELRSDIIQKEKEIDFLQAEIHEKAAKRRKKQINSEIMLQESEQYKLLQKRMDKGEILTKELLLQYSELTMRLFPNFYSFISGKQYALNEREFNVCILLRLHVNPTTVAVLLGLQSSLVTRASKRVLKKIFDKDGDSKALASELARIF